MACIEDAEEMLPVRQEANGRPGAEQRLGGGKLQAADEFQRTEPCVGRARAKGGDRGRFYRCGSGVRDCGRSGPNAQSAKEDEREAGSQILDLELSRKTAGLLCHDRTEDQTASLAGGKVSAGPTTVRHKLGVQEFRHFIGRY